MKLGSKTYTRIYNKKVKTELKMNKIVKSECAREWFVALQEQDQNDEIKI